MLGGRRGYWITPDKKEQVLTDRPFAHASSINISTTRFLYERLSKKTLKAHVYHGLFS